MPTTEISLASFKAGFNRGDSNDPNVQALKAITDAVVQADGYQQAHFGPLIETPNVLQALITWDSLDHHEAFMNSPQYVAILKAASPAFDGAPSVFHVDFKPNGALQHALSAPVTELAAFTFESHDPLVEERFGRFAKILNDDASNNGSLGSAYGWGYEEVEHEKLGEGKKGKNFYTAVGWPSVDKHMEFQKTKIFSESVHLVHGSVAVEVHHAAMFPYAG